MDKKEFAKLKVGDKVRIVSEKAGDYWDPEGGMDKYLGKVMTVRGKSKIRGCNVVLMEEDYGTVFTFVGRCYGWCAHMIAEKVKPVKEVKRKAKVGEWIKIVKPDMAFGHYKKGDIIYVPQLWHNGCPYPVFSDGSYLWVGHDEYVVLENYVPEDKPKEVTISGTWTFADKLATEFNPKKIEYQPVTIAKHLVKDRKTIVKLSDGRVGIAVCSPDDEFDIYEGLRLATERAYGRAEPYKKPSPVKEVKRKAKKGEYIKIVNRWRTEIRYRNGAIFKVVDEVESYGMKDWVQVDGGCFGRITVKDAEYVVLENYKPTK